MMIYNKARNEWVELDALVKRQIYNKRDVMQNFVGRGDGRAWLGWTGLGEKSMS